MGEAELRAVILEGQGTIAEFFLEMPEPARRQFASMASGLYKSVWKAYLDSVGGGKSRDIRVQLERAQCALLASASPSQLRGLHWGVLDVDTAIRVLSDRSPSWLAEWVEGELSSQLAAWRFTRTLVDAGLCPPPNCDNWVLGFIGGGRGGLRRYEKAPLKETIQGDPRLPEMIWRFFEVEGTQETSLAQHDKYSSEPYIWSTALVALASDGSFPRQRFLDASLGALERDFIQFRAGWFSAFHEQLSPTVEERAERQATYLRLLSSRIPPTVAFAANALAVLDKAGKLDHVGLINGIAPGLMAKAKKTALASLKLVSSAMKGRPAGVPAGLRAVASCLAHEAAEVQVAALDLLDRIGAPDDVELSQLIARNADLVAPSVRARLDRWIGQGSRQLSLPEQGAPSSVEPEILRPVADRDEAIELLSSVIERLDPISDMERALDGVSRFCHERGDQFELKTGPLLKRARKLLAARGAGKAMAGENPRLDLCALAVSWITASAPPAISGPLSIHQLLSLRIQGVALRAIRGEARPLLAFPTQSSGWIDAAALVDRAQAGHADWLDAIQALLRVRPDPAVAASPAATAVPGEFGRALRYALGAAPEPPFAEPSMWLSAHRARFPTEDASFLAVAGPDGAQTARYTTRLGVEQEYRYLIPEVEVRPPLPDQFVPAHLPVLLHCWENGQGAEHPAVRRARVCWAATVWPASLEPLFASGFGRSSADWLGSSGLPEEAEATYFETILHSDTPLGPVSLFAVILGLNAYRKDAGAFAVDALICCLDRGRLDHPRFGEALGMLVASGGASLGRVSTRLGAVAAYSSALAGYVRDAIEVALPSVGDSPTNDLSHLLALQNELCASSNTAVRLPAARSALERLKGGGKRARLAAELLGRVGTAS